MKITLFFKTIRNSFFGIPFLVFCFLVFFGPLSMNFALAQSPNQSQLQVIEKILAIVNNEVILNSDLKNFVFKLNTNGFIDEILLFGDRPASLKGNRKAQLTFLINEKILDSEIKRLNLSVTSERVDQELKEMAKKNNLSKSEFLLALKEQKISASEYQDFIKSRIERQSLIEAEVTSKIRISDDEIASEYSRKNPHLNRSGSFEYTLSHIFFNSKKSNAKTANERADQVVKKLREGSSFEILAEQYSEDPNFATGGLLGSFKAGEFSKEFEAAVNNLSPGEYSQLVKSKTGIHILKLINKKVIADPQFEKEKEKIRNQLFEKAFFRYFNVWLNQKKDDSFIRIND